MDPKNETLIKKKKLMVFSAKPGFYNQNEGGTVGFDTASGG